jgi:hypothetical protein
VIAVTGRLGVLVALLTACGDAGAGPSDVTAAAIGPSRTATSSPATSGPPTPSPTLWAPATAPPDGPCPASGYKLWIGAQDGAMGLRVVSLQVTNCGRRSLTLRGYPVVTVLDERLRPLPVPLGRGAVAQGISVPAVRTLRVAPGRSASSELSWRLLVLDDGTEPVTGRHLRVAPAARRPAQVVDLLVDLGTTRELRATPWHS